MHMRGTPSTMHGGPFAAHVMRDVVTGLKAALAVPSARASRNLSS